ncbi:hypothetical protein RHSIM_Rhsim01G0053600 [Rhododendron simsii]|uniref:Uncharacterized protein n=1 Tax=Rhododendron simsii TaxID=118357 RepID=A0A834LZK1_RHOSS|nr:hypothetical protein RHSIM_Rhsim01G0053600 [Rhododendron simsii]
MLIQDSSDVIVRWEIVCNVVNRWMLRIAWIFMAMPVPPYGIRADLSGWPLLSYDLHIRIKSVGKYGIQVAYSTVSVYLYNGGCLKTLWMSYLYICIFLAMMMVFDKFSTSRFDELFRPSRALDHFTHGEKDET